jgi:anti-anti-sigma regulatory factor
MSLAHVYYTQHEGIHVFKLTGSLHFESGSAIEQALAIFRLAKDSKETIIDLTEAESLDSTIIGMIGQIGVNQSKKAKLVVSRQDIEQMLVQVGFDRFFIIVFNDGHSPLSLDDYVEFKPLKETKRNLEKRVRTAHEWLSQVDARNAKQFKTVLDQFKRH